MCILKILFRNAFHNKLRSGLTILGIAVAILAFGLLRTVINAWYAGVEASSTTRLVTSNAISIIFPLPISYQGKNPAGRRREDRLLRQLVWRHLYRRKKFLSRTSALNPRPISNSIRNLSLIPCRKKPFLPTGRASWRAGNWPQNIGWKLRRYRNAERNHLSGELGFCFAGHLSRPG